MPQSVAGIVPGERQAAELCRTARPRHRIIHIADLHVVTLDELAADLRDQDPNITLAAIEAEHRAVLAVARRVQRGQRVLIRWLAKYNGVHRVYVEGLTDGNLTAYMH